MASAKVYKSRTEYIGIAVHDNDGEQIIGWGANMENDILLTREEAMTLWRELTAYFFSEPGSEFALPVAPLSPVPMTNNVVMLNTGKGNNVLDFALAVAA